MLCDALNKLRAGEMGSGSLQSHRDERNLRACYEKYNLGDRRASADTIRRPCVRQPVEGSAVERVWL